MHQLSLALTIAVATGSIAFFVPGPALARDFSFPLDMPIGVHYGSKPPDAMPIKGPFTNLDKYLKFVQQRLSRNWPGLQEDKALDVTFAIKVLKDGTITGTNILSPDATEEDKRQIEQLVAKVKPLEPLPKNAPSSVELQFRLNDTPSRFVSPFSSVVNRQFLSFRKPSVTYLSANVSVEVVGPYQDLPRRYETFESNPSFDLNKYLTTVSKKIEAAMDQGMDWGATNEKLVFEVDNTGGISNLYRGASGNNAADLAAIRTVESSAPLPPLPAADGEKIRIEATLNHIYNGEARPISRVRCVQIQPWESPQGHDVSVSQVIENAKIQELSPGLFAAVGSKQASVIINLDKTGYLVKNSSPPNLQIYHSSKDPNIDAQVQTLARKLEPFKLNGFRQTSGCFLLTISDEKAKITAVPIIDWRTYRNNITASIGGNWLPPTNAPGNCVNLTFKIHGDGKFSDLFFLPSVASSEFQDSVQKAIIKASPFWNLPEGTPDIIDVKCSLAYDSTINKSSQPVFSVGPWADRDSPVAHERLGDNFRAKRDEVNAAKEYLASARLKENAAIEIKLGQAQQAKGDADAAKATFERARKMCPELPDFMYLVPGDESSLNWQSSWVPQISPRTLNAKEHYQYAKQLTFAGDYSQARAELRLVRQLPGDAFYTKAENLLKLLAAAESFSTEFRFLKIAAFELQNDHYQPALEAYLNAQKFVQPTDNKELSMIITMMGNVYLEKDDQLDAIHCFLKALSLDPTNALATAGLEKARQGSAPGPGPGKEAPPKLSPSRETRD